MRLPLIGREQLIANKAAVARDKDRFDLALLARTAPTKLERAEAPRARTSRRKRSR